jgi:hypothetical protein
MGIVISTRIGGMGVVEGGGGKGEELDTPLGGDMCDMWVCGDGDWQSASSMSNTSPQVILKTLTAT